jgi:hypothetical protein
MCLNTLFNYCSSEVCPLLKQPLIRLLIDVRGHLYRHHRIFQCRRCSKLFKDEDSLQSHFMAIDPCGLQESVAAEGITPALEKQLRSRKKTNKAQTEDERWQHIYRIIFPMEIVPSSGRYYSTFRYANICANQIFVQRLNLFKTKLFNRLHLSNSQTTKNTPVMSSLAYLGAPLKLLSTMPPSR